VRQGRLTDTERVADCYDDISNTDHHQE
jgi:hypothetical protein